MPVSRRVALQLLRLQLLEQGNTAVAVLGSRQGQSLGVCSEGAALRAWLLRLSPEARLDALTCRDPDLVVLLLRAARLLRRTEGATGRVIVLPASPGEAADVTVQRAPAELRRLARLTSAESRLAAGLRVLLRTPGCLAALRFTPELVEDAPALLTLLDAATDGGFLARPPAWPPSGTPLTLLETPWLGGLGAASLAQLAVNAFEVALWARLRTPAQRPERPPVSGRDPLAALTPPQRAAAEAAAPLLALQAAARAARAALPPVADEDSPAQRFQGARVGLLALIDALAAVAGPPGTPGGAESLLWQPLLVAETGAARLRASLGAACIAQAATRAVRAAERAAAALLAEEEMGVARAQAAERAKAEQLRQRLAASSRAAVIPEPTQPPLVPSPAEHVLASSAGEHQPSRPRRPPTARGWLPGCSGASAAAQPTEPAPPPPPLETPAEPTPRALASGAVTVPTSDYGRIFSPLAHVEASLFWSPSRPISPATSERDSVASADSFVTSTSAAARREEAVAGLLADRGAVPSPERHSPRGRPRAIRASLPASRSLGGSPEGRPVPQGRPQSPSGGAARLVALRRSGSIGEGSFSAAAAAARPFTPLPGRRPRQSSDDDGGRYDEVASRGGSGPVQPLSIALGALPRLSAELLRRVAAPAQPASAMAPQPVYGDAAVMRRLFWTAPPDAPPAAVEAAARRRAAAAALGAQLRDFATSVQAAAAAAAPARAAAVQRVSRALQDVWPRARTRVFGSEATGLALPTSDVDLVCELPPVRRLPPILEAGILEGRNAIAESHIKRAARELARQEWTVAESLHAIENTAVPLVSLCVASPLGGAPPVRVDVSFNGPSHAGLATAELVRELLVRWPALAPLTLVLKQHLKERSLHHAYTGGLSSYCLLLLLTAFLKHDAALGEPAEPACLGRLLADVLHFYGRVFDPRRTAVALAPPPPGPVAGLFPTRGQDSSALIDLLFVLDPLCPPEAPATNVGRNCFRLLQIQKALQVASLALDGALERGQSEGLLASIIRLQ